MRSKGKGSRFTLGVWGLRVCSLDVAFMFATVRNRPRATAWGPCGRAYGKFCERGHFGSFKRRVALFRVAGVALLVFCNVSKIALCGRRNTFASFWKDEFQFSWQARHFGRVHLHFAWQVQPFRRVVLRVFANRIVRTRCKFRRRGILWDVTKIDGSLARNINFCSTHTDFCRTQTFFNKFRMHLSDIVSGCGVSRWRGSVMWQGLLLFYSFPLSWCRVTAHTHIDMHILFRKFRRHLSDIALGMWCVRWFGSVMFQGLLLSTSQCLKHKKVEMCLFVDMWVHEACLLQDGKSATTGECRLFFRHA